MLWILVNGVVIGYMAGALNSRSTNFKRMLGAGMTAAVIIATIQAYLNYTVSLTPSRTMNHGLMGEHIVRSSRSLWIRDTIHSEHCFRSNSSYSC